MDRIIIENKLQPPNCEQMLARKRLLEPILTSDARLTSICADAGYGKTVLLAQVHANLKEPCIWYRFEVDDCDPILMLHHLVAGIRHLFPGCCSGGDAPGHMAATDSSDPQAVVERFISEFQNFVSSPFNILLDDFHLIADSDAAITAIKRLVTALPDGVRFFISSRSRPDLKLSQLRAAGELIEVDSEELVFNADEVDEFFQGIAPGRIDSGALDAVVESAEGWPAALALIRNRLKSRRGSDALLFAPAVLRDIKEYLVEEVWRDLDEDLKVFLRGQAFLAVMDPGICSSVAEDGFTAADARRLLERATESNILVDRLGSGSEYRAHSLFRAFLKQELLGELDQQGILERHSAYARHFEERGQVARAAHHFVEAGLHEELARLIEDHGESLLDSGHWGTLSYWLDRIPAEPLEQRPWLCYFKARVSGLNKELDVAMRLLTAAQRGFIKADDRHGLYLFAIAFQDIMITTNRYDDALKIAHSILDFSSDSRECMFAFNRIALVHMLQGQPEKAMENWGRAREHVEDDDVAGHMQIQAWMISGCFFTGEFNDILTRSAELMERFDDLESVVPRFTVLSFRAIALIETGRYDEAARLIERSAELLGEEFRARERFLDIIEARIKLYDGNSREGRRTIEKIVEGCDNQFLLGPDIPLVFIGNLDRRKRAFDRALQRHQESRELCQPERLYAKAHCLVNIGADMQRIGKNGSGAAELEEAEELATLAGAAFILAQVRFHQAWQALQAGDEATAHDKARESLDAAARNGYQHFVCQEGRITLDLLAFAFARDIQREFLVEQFGRVGSTALSALAPLLQSKDAALREATVRALAAAGGLSAVPRLQRMLRDQDESVRISVRAALESIRDGADAPEDMLTRREYEILEMIAEGATNLEIGERLIITEPTVKSHVSSIFRKLSVSTRVQAAMYYNQHAAGRDVESSPGSGTGI